MPVLGAENEKVNASKVKWFFAGGSDEYVALNRKMLEWTRGQRDFPTTGLGVLYYSEKLRGRFIVLLAYTTGEVGNGVPRNFDEMITEAALTGEIPETAFVWKLTDKQGSPTTKTYTVNAKCVRYKSFEAGGEGETLAELEFVITDAAPTIA